MAYTTKRNNVPVLWSGSSAASRSSFASVISTASSNTFFQNRSAASPPVMMKSASSSSSVRFNLFDNNRRSIFSMLRHLELSCRLTDTERITL
ncbi:hypothetical protein Tco_0005141 [Tanacetum coccineum]